MTEEWKSAQGWADAAKAAGIDRKVMPHSERNVRDKATRESWSFRDRDAGGGGREYHVSALPAAFRKALTHQAVKAPSRAPVQLSLDLPRIEDMKTYQRGPLEARAALLAEIDRLVLTGHTVTHAIAAVVDAAATGALPPELQRLVPIANARGGASGSRTLSERSLKRWRAAVRQADGQVAALAPTAVPESPIPAWAPTFMQLYARPTKPGIPEVLEGWPAGEDRPSYDQAKRFLKRVDAITRNMGRMGARALKSIKAYVARDFSELWPGAVFIGDGHTYKQEVAHPVHGGPFRPEITAILDVYTRKWVGWSAALAENTWSVADAVRHAATTATQCAILYYDNGAGAKNNTWDDDVAGLAARLSMTKLHSAPWSSQARGVIERFNSSVLHKAARARPTYVGQRMDQDARRSAFKITRAEIKAAGTSRLLTSWADFIADIDAAMVAYNARPHSSLPKIIDPATTRRRHMTPAEAWDKAIADGWQPDPIPADEARTLFRPAVRRAVRRGLIAWIGNEYFAPELESLHGEEVMVSYDLHDAGSVLVSLLDGRFVCEAKWNGHKRSYVPVSFARRAEEQRVAGKIARLESHKQVALAELHPGTLIEHQPAEVITPEQFQAAEAEYARLETRNAEAVPAVAATLPGERPIFADDTSWAGWVLANPGAALDEDIALLRRKLRDRNFRMLLEMQGLDVGALSALAA